VLTGDPKATAHLSAINRKTVRADGLSGVSQALMIGFIKSLMKNNDYRFQATHSAVILRV